MAVKIAKWRDQVFFAQNGAVRIINEKTGAIADDAPTTALMKALHFAQLAALMKVDDNVYGKMQADKRKYAQMAQGLLEVVHEARAQAASGIQLPAVTNEEREAQEKIVEINARIAEAASGHYVINHDAVKIEKVDRELRGLK